MSFYSSFISLCNSSGKTPSRVIQEIGMKKSAVTRWKNGGNPTDATAQKVADYFGVPVTDLIGGQKENPSAPTSEGRSSKDDSLIRWFRSLPPEKQKAILIAQDGPIDAAD